MRIKLTDYSRELSTVAKIERRLSSIQATRPFWQRGILGVCNPFWTCAAIGVLVGAILALAIVILVPSMAYAQSASASASVTINIGRGGGVRWGTFGREGPMKDAYGNIVSNKKVRNEGWSPEIREALKRGDERAEMCGGLPTWSEQRFCLNYKP